MRHPACSLWFCAAAWLCAAPAPAAEPLPRSVQTALAASGLPLKSFGFYVQPVEAGDAAAPAALAALNAEQPFMMASTTKLVTSLAALDLLGPTHGWHTRAFSTGPVAGGRLTGDLVLAGGHAGLTPDELRRWFRQMHGEGVSDVQGRIVLMDLMVLHEEAQPALTPVNLAQGALAASPVPRAANLQPLVVAVQPSSGVKAVVTLQPRPLGVVVVNDVFMGGGCSAWAQWTPVAGGSGSQLWVRGRWDASCGSRDIAYVRPPPSVMLAPPALPQALAPTPLASATRLVAALWAESGGTLRGRVVAGERVRGAPPASARWTSEFTTPLPDLIREMNKTSNNMAARQLLLSLSEQARPSSALREAQDRVHAWLRAQGLADGDIRIDVGSGQSRAERGKPRALVHLLLNAWRTGGAKALLDSLPIAGVDGTLAHRMQHGSATGQAYLKTGTLSDTRALAGYVHAKSGKVYAVAAMVNHPSAARATPALDAFIEWVAENG